MGDACDPCPDDPDDDADDDGVCGDRDNCPEIANGGQADGDGDGTGDACDRCDDRVAGDGDGDGVCGEVDNCPELGNGDQADGDGDGRGDACDPCPADPHDDADGDGVCGDLDVCPARADAGQADRDGDGVGDACDPDRDGDGVPDVDDVCPEVADRGQADVDADGVGDACAAVYLFEGFEEGLDRWEVRSGAWGIDAGGTGARRGGGALTDSPGEQWPVAGRIGLLQPLDLSAARQPRLSAWVRYVVGADQQLVLEISAPGVETLALSLLDPARGTENRAHELVHADLAAFAGLPEVRLELRIDAGADLTRGVRIDDLVVAEAPELPVVRLPFSAGFDRGPSPLRLEGDWAWYDAGGTARGVVASTAGPWPAQRSWQRATVLRRLDLSDAARPRLRLLYTGRLSAETTLEVEARTPDDTLVLPVVGPGLHASEPEPLEVALDELAGEPEVRLALRYRLEWFHDALFRIDDLELVDLMDAPPAELPLSEGFEGGLDRWRAQGWTRVEDAARPGRLAMTDSADGTSPLNSTRTLELLPRLDLSQAVRPRLVAWARWRLEAHQQAFSVELLPSDGPVARVDWSDGRPRQEGMARLEADLSAHAGDPALRLRFRLRTERVTSDGVLLDDVRVEEAPAVAPLPVPYHEDFGGALPDWLLECGWSRDASRHRSAPTALHDSPGGTLAAPGTCRAELLRPLDLTDLVEPQLVVWVWWNLHDGGRSGLYLDLWTDDGGPAQTVELAREGESGVFARVEVDLAGLAGRPDVRLRFRTHSPDTQRPVGVAIDDLSVGERPRPEPVVAPWREDFEGPGVEERWEAQGPWGTTDAVHRSWFTAMTDSPQGVSPPFSTTWVRTRRPIDLSGLASPELVFACRHRMGGQHTVWMDVLPAGGGAVETFLHGWYTAHADWHEHRVDLTPYRDGGPVGLRWRMRSEWWRDDGVWVDDVEVREAAGE